LTRGGRSRFASRTMRALPLFLVVACLLPAPGRAAAARCPGRDAEACTRAALGIPADARRVLVLSQSSHLDWDWLHTFEDYYTTAVDGVFRAAVALLAADPAYYYSVAEMGYLARFVAAHPELLPALRAAGSRLRIVGGGITSPDSLLPHGEAFIRDYLVGKTWVDATLGLPLREAWLPDDFGLDPELPVLLEAMGLEAVGFSRVPGVDTLVRWLGAAPPAPGSLASELARGGADFVWRAADGSRTLAHWMPRGYCEGDFGLSPPGSAATAIAASLKKLLAVNAPASPTPYIFLPIGCDFKPPRPDLLDIVRQWNAEDYPATGVWAVAATFDHYVTLVRAHRSALRVRRFDPTPYWQGFYASRPALKTGHLAAVRTLLAAEVLGAVADGALHHDRAAWQARVAARSAALHAAWTTLVPSNHHDYVTGTALDAVYQGEQLPRLADARAQAEAARAEATAEIARALRHPGVVVLNPLGFARRGLVELADAPADLPRGTRVQPSAEGTLLFFGRAPSLGYASGRRAAVRPPRPAVSLVPLPDGGGFVLANGLLRATIARAAGWGITALVDERTGRDVIAPGAVANTLRVYADDGGLYRFGHEMAGCALTPEPGGVDVDGTPSAATVLEAGPLRARVRAEVRLGAQVFVKEYQLVAGEPFLRMVTTGGAPPGTSVLVEVPLAGPIDTLEHGTPYHWDRKAAERAGPVTFEATHDFLILRRHGRAVAALFHDGVPAWAAQRDGVLLGALWRNAPQERCDYYGAQGTDAASHTVAYALRVPTGVASPRTGRQLREALAYTMPLAATLAPGGPGTLPARFSLAAAAPRSAILTAAKAATADPTALVLRIYQPTNRPLGVTVRTGARRRFPHRTRLAVVGTTALETPLGPRRAAALALTGDARRFRVFTERALTTVEIRAR